VKHRLTRQQVRLVVGDLSRGRGQQDRDAEVMAFELDLLTVIRDVSRTNEDITIAVQSGIPDDADMRLLTYRAAAERIGCDPKTISRWVAAGKLAAQADSGRIPERELRRFIERTT